jgi:hypothetical protein
MNKVKQVTPADGSLIQVVALNVAAGLSRASLVSSVKNSLCFNGREPQWGCTGKHDTWTNLSVRRIWMCSMQAPSGACWMRSLHLISILSGASQRVREFLSFRPDSLATHNAQGASTAPVACPRATANSVQWHQESPDNKV